MPHMAFQFLKRKINYKGPEKRKTYLKFRRRDILIVCIKRIDSTVVKWRGNRGMATISFC
jgi:hypothetical protein